MKKTLTLGLLVFFVGVLMTACGSKSSGPSAAPIGGGEDGTTVESNVDPINQDADCMDNRRCDFSATYEVLDIDGYEEVFNYNRGSGYTDTPSYGDSGSSFSNFFKDLAADFFVSYLNDRNQTNCSDRYNSFCNYEITNTNTGYNDSSDGYDVGGDYDSDVRYNYRRKSNGDIVVKNITIVVNTGRAQGDSVKFYPEERYGTFEESRNKLYTQDGDLGLIYVDGEYEMIDTRTDTVIGVLY